MIRAWLYRPHVDEHEDAPTDQLADLVDPKQALLWVDCVDPTESELDSLTKQLDISHLAAEDLHHGGQRTKLEHYRDHFHVAVHDCTLVADVLTTREIDIVFGDGWLLSVRQPSDNSSDPAPFALEPVIHRFEMERTEEEVWDEGFLLWSFLDVIVDRYFDVADRFDDRLDEVEEIVFSADTGDNIPKEVFDLRRGMVHFRRAVAPLREVLAQLLRREAECLGDESIVHMQDVYDHVLRVTDWIETQRDLLTGLLEADLAVVSNRLNQVMKRMTSWGAILLGSTLIAGIYGMNFKNMPELGWSFGYPLALGSMLALTIFLYTWFKRRDWL
ncbi:MAG TPA: magnesium/cobalt transporter CorA [Acidimicrobiia bacterium]|nr:magnesium/cobalt transporter CorA [Acidimicrobiia bacterium]